MRIKSELDEWEWMCILPCILLNMQRIRGVAIQWASVLIIVDDEIRYQLLGVLACLKLRRIPPAIQNKDWNTSIGLSTTENHLQHQYLANFRTMLDVDYPSWRLYHGQEQSIEWAMSAKMQIINPAWCLRWWRVLFQRLLDSWQGYLGSAPPLATNCRWPFVKLSSDSLSELVLGLLQPALTSEKLLSMDDLSVL